MGQVNESGMNKYSSTDVEVVQSSRISAGIGPYCGSMLTVKKIFTSKITASQNSQSLSQNSQSLLRLCVCVFSALRENWYQYEF